MSILYDQIITEYDDSLQPTGDIAGFPIPHLKMKKLHHALFLKVEGPDNANDAVNKAIRDAITSGLLAAIIAAAATGGVALSAAIDAALVSLRNSLGNAFIVSTHDEQHWIEWWT